MIEAPPAADHLAGLASADDVAQLYRLFLGRDAEPAVLADAPPRPLHELAAEMAASDEINRCVLHALVQHRPVPHRAFDDATLNSLADWLDARLPAFDQAPGEAALRGTIAALLGRLYAHPQIARWLLAAHGSLFTHALDELAAMCRAGAHRFEGKIEFANRDFISGWALDLSGRQPRLQLEIRHGDQVVASALALSWRPDIHRALGGDGLVGFRARWHAAGIPRIAAGAAVELRLHEASTGALIGPPYRYENSIVEQLTVAQLLAKEFDEIKRRLDTLAGLVPQALSYSAFPLAHYDLYRRMHRVPPPPWLTAGLAGSARSAGPPPGHRFAVLLDAHGASANGLRLSIDGLREQVGGLAWTLRTVGADAALAQVVQAQAAADARITCAATWDEAMRGLTGALRGSDNNGNNGSGDNSNGDGDDWIVLMQAGERLDPHALAWMAQAATPQRPALLYWDEDRISCTADLGGIVERHHDPVLRTRFDPDSMLELNVVGTSFAARRHPLDAALALLAQGSAAVDSPDPLAPAARERLVWALHRQGGCLHLPHVLLSRLAEVNEVTEAAETPHSADPGATKRLAAHAEPRALDALLPDAWQGRSWQRMPDPIAPAPGKPLLRWRPQRPGASLGVLIPTRDQGELLAQCIHSLRALAARPDAIEIVVADNGSTDAATLAYLEALQREPGSRVLRIDEPFNWSRLNNQMAEAVGSDLLLFLNNDTRMLTREWDDMLRGLLERPEIGAVGARLLYEDMTVQHAGVQFGHEGFVGHVGVGRSTDDVQAFPASQLTREVSAVTGAFLACRREVWQRVGVFDEQRLAVTFNDVDWCVRVRDAGHKVLYAPALSLIHYESKSRGFDFMSVHKQQRADHERQHLLRLHPNRFRDDPFGSEALSGWVHDTSSLR